ncbi:MAG TPA: hypothetical protein VFZ61_03715 [Polyangiales bacterium]
MAGDRDAPSGIDDLTLFELRFVEAYMGEARGVGSTAVTMAGGTANARSAAAYACEVLKRPHVRKALQERIEDDPLVAGRLERLRFLTRVVRGQEVEVRAVLSRKKRGGGYEIHKVEAPPSIADRMSAARDLAKAAGEHLDARGDEDANAMLLRALAGMNVGELFQLVRGGGETQ